MSLPHPSRWEQTPPANRARRLWPVAAAAAVVAIALIAVRGSRWLVLSTNEGLSAWSVQQRRLVALDVDDGLSATGLLVR